MMENVKSSDLTKMINWLKKHQSFNDEEIVEKKKKLNDSKTIQLFNKNDECVGFVDQHDWENDFFKKCLTIEIGLDDSFDQHDKLKEAIKQMIEHAKSNGINMISMAVGATETMLEKLMKSLDFNLWYGYAFMQFEGNRFEVSSLTKRNVTEADFHDYYTVLGECFTPQRQSLDMPPFNVYDPSNTTLVSQQKEHFLAHAHNNFMYYYQGNWVGCALLIDGDIDDLFVLPSYRNQGFGKAILKDITNVALDQNITPYIGVTTWNKNAHQLYLNHGFKEFLQVNYYRIFI